MPPDPIFGKEVALALEAIPGTATTLQIATFLRTRLDPELARRAAELHDLRIRKKGRFDPNYLAFVTKRGLEQATPQLVAEARAKQIANCARGALVWDATCGIGADSVAIALSGSTGGTALVASDRDLHTLRYARANLEHHGVNARVVVADAGRPPVVRADVVVLDPDRRASGARSLDPERWSPRFSLTLRVARSFDGACVKLAPAFDPARVGEGLEAVGAWVWVSLRGSLCEVSLWLGALADGRPGRSVLALDGRGGVATLAGEPEDVPALSPAAAREVRWLAEPDPAVIRSGLLGNLARAEALAPLAPRIAYLGGAERPASRLLAAWRVLGTASLDRRRVRALLGRHDIGPVVVKKRGHPESADELARRFRGPGTRRGLLVVTRLEHTHLALLCDPTPGVVAPGVDS
ncbi:MAG: class I SAM-dependent methyltransferase [Planctomycetota bacterium]|nr:MAG: class I SAM-dependent methyltransferase [Planctomycetota bacterium]